LPCRWRPDRYIVFRIWTFSSASSDGLVRRISYAAVQLSSRRAVSRLRGYEPAPYSVPYPSASAMKSVIVPIKASAYFSSAVFWYALASGPAKKKRAN
jgi:hypothetical protein